VWHNRLFDYLNNDLNSPVSLFVAIDQKASSEDQRRHQDFLVLPFVLEVGEAAPPSVRLLPSRPYSGSPIGTAYEVQLFAGKTPDELPKRRKMVQMSIRMLERPPRALPSAADMALNKGYLFSQRSLSLKARLDKGVYKQG